MEVRTELDEAIRAVARFLVADQPLCDTLDRVAVLARQAIGRADAVGITLLDERSRPTTAISTSDISPEIDQAQYDENVGPCLDAYRQRRRIRVDDTAAVGDRWPKFSLRATEGGIGSTLSLPMVAGDEVYGAFNLYARPPSAFSPDDEADAELFATQAAVVLANARFYWNASDLAAGLRYAMQSRAAIEQAKGMVMATRHCTADEAFQILVAASQRSNVKLRDLATRIVTNHGKLSPSAPPGDGKDPARRES